MHPGQELRLLTEDEVDLLDQDDNRDPGGLHQGRVAHLSCTIIDGFLEGSKYIAKCNLSYIVKQFKAAIYKLPQPDRGRLFQHIIEESRLQLDFFLGQQSHDGRH